MLDLIKNDCLIEYQGGGYDGCFWEWNYAYIDFKGDFVSIWNSGINGCTSLSEIKEYMENSDEFYIYDLSDERDLEEFAKESSEHNVFRVSNWFDENRENGSPIVMTCAECKKKFTTSEMSAGSYHGDGGIGIVDCHFLCKSCQEKENSLINEEV